MGQIKFTEVFPYSAQDLIDLVMDAEKYTDISPYIRRVDVTDKGGNIIDVQTTIETPVIPVEIRYGCDLERVGSDGIKARATKSPFKEMSGELKFTTLANGHTQVDCVINYQKGWNPIAAVAANVMESQIETGIAKAREYLATKLTAVPESSSQSPKPPSGSGPSL